MLFLMEIPKKIEVKTLIYNRTGYKINWKSNPENETNKYQIVKYQIWRALQTSTYPPSDIEEYTFIAEVDSKVMNYLDYSDNIDSNDNYFYIVRAVDSEGHLSPLIE